MAHPHGLISWADVSAVDMDAAKEFYGGLFGWLAEDQFMDGQRVYSMFSKDGKAVAGLGAHPQELIDQGVPPMWSSYVAVADADAVAAAFTEHGGSLMMPPMDVMDSGRMFFGIDPTGAALGFWQAGTHAGAEAFNEPGFMTWNELLTHDLEGALEFYAKVLPWVPAPMEGSPDPYFMFMLGEKPTGGAMAMPPSLPDGIPAHWMVYFDVEDADATAVKAVELGGEVRMSPFDVGVGRVAVIADPQGGVFSVITPSTPAT